jgi:hypothetical protein
MLKVTGLKGGLYVVYKLFFIEQAFHKKYTDQFELHVK